MSDFLRNIRRAQQQLSKPGSDLFGLDAQAEHFKILYKLYAKHGLELCLTCGACPEQYSVFKDGIQVAYYRLRHGTFRVDYPDCGDETIYEAEPQGDGVFENTERFKYMIEAMHKVLNKLIN